MSVTNTRSLYLFILGYLLSFVYVLEITANRLQAALAEEEYDPVSYNTAPPAMPSTKYPTGFPTTVSPTTVAPTLSPSLPQSLPPTIQPTSASNSVDIVALIGALTGLVAALSVIFIGWLKYKSIKLRYENRSQDEENSDGEGAPLRDRNIQAPNILEQEQELELQVLYTANGSARTVYAVDVTGAGRDAATSVSLSTPVTPYNQRRPPEIVTSRLRRGSDTSEGSTKADCKTLSKRRGAPASAPVIYTTRTEEQIVGAGRKKKLFIATDEDMLNNAVPAPYKEEPSSAPVVMTGDDGNQYLLVGLERYYKRRLSEQLPSSTKAGRENLPLPPPSLLTSTQEAVAEEVRLQRLSTLAEVSSQDSSPRQDEVLDSKAISKNKEKTLMLS